MLAHETSTERLPVGQRKPIDAAKDLVSILELAERLCPEGARRVGKTMVARCPLPGHDDKTPSFYVYPETGSFWCFGCQRGGDVVHLAAHAWGHGDDMATAAAELLHEFGHEIPQRPQAWFARQERQKPVRDALEEVKVKHVQRRLYRIFAPAIEKIEDQAERKAEKVQTWHDLRHVAALIVAGRRAA